MSDLLHVLLSPSSVCECEFVMKLKYTQIRTCLKCAFYCYFCVLVFQLFVDVEGFL